MLTNDAREQIKTAILSGLDAGETVIEESEDRVTVSVYSLGFFCEFTLSQALGYWEVHGEVKPWSSRFKVDELASVGARLTRLATKMKDTEVRVYRILQAQRVRISYPTLPPVAV